VVDINPAVIHADNTTPGANVGTPGAVAQPRPLPQPDAPPPADDGDEFSATHFNRQYHPRP
jgi:hypothetical protein